MTFHGTCTLPEHVPNAGSKALDAYWASAKLHGHPDSQGKRTMTFSDPDAWTDHVKACKGTSLTYTGNGQGIRGSAYQGKPMPSIKQRDFAPKLGEVGSWVTLPDGTTGQVWCASGPKAVYVATGTEYVAALVSELSPASDPADQLTITPEPEPTPEPTPEPAKAPETVTRMAPSERKAWNRRVADLAREHDAYRAVMDAWDRFTELRLSGASPEDAVTLIRSLA